MKVGDGFTKATNAGFSEPDFEPAIVEYPADWWQAFKARWLPWTTPRITKLSLYRRSDKTHTITGDRGNRVRYGRRRADGRYSHR